MLTAEQKEIRKRRIGSSEIGAILGVDPHRSAFDVFTEKMYPKDEPSDEMRWGSQVEKSIVEYHALKESCSWLPGQTIVHRNGITCATPDAYLIRKLSETRLVPDWCAGAGLPPSPGMRAIADDRLRVLEAKNVGFYRTQLWGDEGDDAPFHCLAQVHWQIGHAQAESGRVEDEAHLVATVGGAPPRKYIVRKDPELFALMMDRAEKFHRDHIATGKPPALDGSDAADEYLKRRYDLVEEEVLPYDEQADTIRQAILDLEQRAEEIDAADKTLRQTLKNLIGGKAGIEGVATWKKSKDSTDDVTDWQLVAELLATHLNVAKDAFDALVASQTRKGVVTKKGSRRLVLVRPKKAKAAKAA